MAAANALAEQLTSPGGQPYVRMLRYGALFAACLDNLRLGGNLSICHYPDVNNLLVLNASPPSGALKSPGLADRALVLVGRRLSVSSAT